MYRIVFALTLVAALISTELAAADAETLYTRFGGYDAIARFVDSAFPRVASHPQLRRLFQGHSQSSQMRQRQHIVEILCAATGGPCLYTGAEMNAVHRGLRITSSDWDVFIRIISAALDQSKISGATKLEFLEMFERRFRPDVVEANPQPSTRKGETPPMSPFKVHSIESAPEASRLLLTNLKNEVGFIPNLAATMAESPALLDAFTALRSINGRRSSLSPGERELVSIAVASEYGCSYCVAAHSTFAVKVGAPESIVAELRDGRPPSDRRIAALTTFARSLVRKNGQMTEEDVATVVAEGFERRHILDLLATTAQVALGSQMFLLARTPLDAAFQPRAWNSSAAAY